MWQNKKPYIMVLPTILVLGILFFGGLVNGAIESLDMTQGFHKMFRFYSEVLKSVEFWESFYLTIRISILSTIVSVSTAFFIIMLLYMLGDKIDNKKSIVISRLFQTPMLFPYLVAAYLIFLILTQGGFISRVCYKLGIIGDMSDFPILVNDKFGWGVIFSYVWKTSPFAILMLYPILLKVEKDWADVGKVLGAGRLVFFKEIVLPLLGKPLKLVSYIIFSYTFLAFEIPYILGITYPKTLSVQSYQIYIAGKFAERPKAFAINVLALSFIVLVGAIFHILSWLRLIIKEGKIG